MKTKITFMIIILSFVGLLSNDINACTTFCIKDKNGKIYFGRNFDFPTGLGQIHINQRNLYKTSLVLPSEIPFTWVSKYGSISFNQNGREFPYGGMNEAGLVIEQMMLDETKYPDVDKRFGLSELQWIQYQLDVSSTVEDVLKSDALVRISSSSQALLHFLVSDVNGNVATIEYLDGKMVYHTGKSLKYSVLSNDTYSCSLDYKTKIDSGISSSYSGRIKSYSDRYVKAATMIESYDKNNFEIVDYAFDILKNVAQGGTQWSIVYDLRNRTIHFKTKNNNNIRKIYMNLFDFACSPKKLFIDIEDNNCSVANFKLFNSESNRKLIDDVWNSVEFMKNIPLEFRAAFANYPNDIKCNGSN